jgi:prepilin-type N-terminal cleavage/methylation domain-containing protein
MRRSLKDKAISGMRTVQGYSGFTIIELIVALFILVVLMSIATSIYFNYINKAKLTVSISILDNASKSIESYHLDNNKYPESIDFTSCVDEKGHAIFLPGFCDQMKQCLYSIESYSLSGTGYVLTARAGDDKHTLLKLTEGKITQQGN